MHVKVISPRHYRCMYYVNVELILIWDLRLLLSNAMLCNKQMVDKRPDNFQFQFKFLCIRSTYIAFGESSFLLNFHFLKVN